MPLCMLLNPFTDHHHHPVSLGLGKIRQKNEQCVFKKVLKRVLNSPTKKIHTLFTKSPVA